MGTPQWRDIGPAEITWDGVSLGYSVENPEGGQHGGTKFRVIEETRESFRDKTGTEEFDSIILGTRVEVEAALTGLAIDQIAKIISGSVLSAGPTSKSVTIKSNVGYSLRENAKELIIKPIIAGVVTTDEKKWIRCALAHPKLNAEVVFDKETQRIYAVMFKCFTNLTTGAIAVIGKNTT